MAGEDAALSIARHGREVRSVFDLLGRDENDLTAALGFTLSRSPALRNKLLTRVRLHGATAAAVRLETSDEAGRTDLEIETGAAVVIIEAKRGWLVPGETQLRSYAPRITRDRLGVLVSLSNASAAWARQILPAELDGVPVHHLSWADVRDDLQVALRESRGHERFWLEELGDYLRRSTSVTDPADSWTYCVAVSDARPGGGGATTFREFVCDHRVYFHPFGNGAGWPKTPPNFLALRWGGHVQRIHRVVASEVVPELQTLWSDIPRAQGTDQPHLVYRLGPSLPGTPIPNGKHYRASRLRVLLDQLLTSDTLADALQGTRALVNSC